MDKEDILNFWFKECTPKQWFEKDYAFDNLLEERFAGTVALAFEGKLDDGLKKALAGADYEKITFEIFPGFYFPENSHMLLDFLQSVPGQFFWPPQENLQSYIPSIVFLMIS